MHARAARRRRPVRLEPVRPAHAARRLPVLPGERHRRHGIRIARLWPPDGHVYREDGLRLGRLACPRGQDGPDQALRHALRSRALSAEPPRGGGAEEARRPTWPEPAAARAPLGDLEPDRQHGTRRLPHRRGGGGQRRRARITARRGRHPGNRRDLRAPRGECDPRGLGRGYRRDGRMSSRFVPLTPRTGAKAAMRRAEGLDRAFADECLDALERYGVLLFPGIGFSDEEQVAFSENLGKIIPMGPMRPDGTQEAVYKITLDPHENPSGAEYLKATI